MLKTQVCTDANTLRAYLADIVTCDCAQREVEPCDDCSEPLDEAALRCGKLYGWSVDQSLEASQVITLGRMRAVGMV